MVRMLGVWVCTLVVLAGTARAGRVPVRVSWGHASAAGTAFCVELLGEGVKVVSTEGAGLEAGERVGEGAIETVAGGGDVDGVVCVLEYGEAPVKEIANLNNIWREVIRQADPETARRLQNDPAYRRDQRRLTLRLDRDGTRGFTVTIDQLLANRAIWVPSLDVYISTGEHPVTFAEHRAELNEWKGKRVLERVGAEAEATLAQYLARWEDMGSPAYKHPSQPEPGHIVCVGWDSAIPKFGIDRGAGVRGDLGNPDKFQFGFDFGRIDGELEKNWRGQSLTDGLPVIVTTVERGSVRYEVEQFAYPLLGPPAERRGDIAMVLMQKVRVTNVGDAPVEAGFTMQHRRQLAGAGALKLSAPVAGTWVCEDGAGGAVLAAQGQAWKLTAVESAQAPAKNAKADGHRTIAISAATTLAAGESREIFLKLPSPVVPEKDRDILLKLDHAAARAATLKFWTDWLARGAQFVVPEPAVNELFRANLWHALRLPRRHGASGEGVKIDLPYSNFAYDQHGIPWPVNQAVYVDHMLYDLRGHHALAAEELAAMYRQNQEANGHVKGFANWVVYTPGMVYASCKHFLLSGDRASFDTLLAPTLKAADWCLAEIARAKQRGDAGGLVHGPLNDLTGEGVWAFNQAYVYAAFDALATALHRIDHPRAAEFRTAADAFKESVTRAFAAASVRSPLVQLHDRTWIPYVPCEARSSGRRMDQWYPTDVDTGAMHLPRLRAIDPRGTLADSLLHDHEDNLYYRQWGMANEPVYNQQATVHLLRDDPKAAIRAFYSYIACAFSHSALEPVEHRFTHGQYFGPPSTDGAWFELYRSMLIQERGADTLLLCAATPRKWLEDGNRVEVRSAPTQFGPLTMTLESRAATGTITARIELAARHTPRELILRLRHPTAAPIRWVKVNDQEWKDFDAKAEQVRIANPTQAKYVITVAY